MFTGFTEETIRFFLDIRFHNNAEYFNENRARYEQFVKEPFSALLTDLAPAMQEIDPQMEIRPYRALARLRRDTRFTRDKSPYKDHLWFTFRRAAEPREGSLGFWFGLSPEWLEWGLGFWGENPQVMDRFRRELAADPARIAAIIDSCHLPERNLVMAGSVRKRMPIPENIPPELAPWYAAKELYIRQAAPDIREAGSRAIYERLLGDFTAMAPIYHLLRGMQDELQLEQEHAAAPKPKDEW